MKISLIRGLMVTALACCLAFTCTLLFAQGPVRVPVSRPPSAKTRPPFFPVGAAPLFNRAAGKGNGGGLLVGQSYDGIDFIGSNCFCLPPDTNAAVGDNYVVETVNLQIRVFNKATGAVLLDEPLFVFFGGFGFGSDPYVLYDDIADRWYVTGIDGSFTGLVLAVSADGNPLDGFPNMYDITNGIGGGPDYPKIGYNRDAIFVTYNDFGPAGTAGATIVSIDKAAASSGTLTYFVSTPEFQFRAMPPAQMHGDNKGGTEWFVSTDGTDAGGSTIRVTEMTNYLSNTPNFTYTSMPVNPYQFALTADQPGGPDTVTTFPNTTTTQVHWRHGHLVTSLASSTTADGFVYPKALWFQIDVNGNGSVKPRMIKSGVIDPGPGVAVQMPSVDEDKQGNLGFTWMESSNAENLSMWIGNRYTNGNFTSEAVAPGGGFFYFSFRIGDYSSTVVDPSDGRTFWSANEYIGANGGPDPFTSDVWLTHIASFRGR